MTRRFWVAVALAVPVAALEMAGHFVEPRRDRQSADVELDSIGPGDACGPLGGLAVLRARRAVDRLAQSQHVHPDRAGDGRRLDLQRRRHCRPRAFSRRLSRHGRRRRDLFRSGGGHHRARAARTGARTQGARAHRRRNSRFARSRAQDRPPRPPGRERRGRRARRGRGRRPAARAPGRQGRDRRRNPRRPQRDRRIHGDGRVDAGRPRRSATASSAGRSIRRAPS